MHILPFPRREPARKMRLRPLLCMINSTRLLTPKMVFRRTRKPIGKASSMGTSQGHRHGPGQISASTNHSIGRGPRGSRMLVGGHIIPPKSPHPALLPTETAAKLPANLLPSPLWGGVGVGVTSAERGKESFVSTPTRRSRASLPTGGRRSNSCNSAPKWRFRRGLKRGEGTLTRKYRRTITPPAPRPGCRGMARRRAGPIALSP